MASIFNHLAFRDSNAAGPFKLEYVEGNEPPWATPSPDDLAVGCDGSTAENPIDRDRYANGGLASDEIRHALTGARQTGLIVARVDVAIPMASLNGIMFPKAGLYFVTVRSEERLRDAMKNVWMKDDHDLLAMGVRLAANEKLDWLMKKNGGPDPMRPGWPRDNHVSLKMCPISVPSVIRANLSKRWSGPPEFFSVRQLHTLDKPQTAQNAIVDGHSERNEERELLRKLLERGEARDEALLSLLKERAEEKPTTTKRA